MMPIHLIKIILLKFIKAQDLTLASGSFINIIQNKTILHINYYSTALKLYIGLITSITSTVSTILFKISLMFL